MLAPKEAPGINWVYPGRGESNEARLSQQTLRPKMGLISGGAGQGGEREVGWQKG